MAKHEVFGRLKTFLQSARVPFIAALQKGFHPLFSFHFQHPSFGHSGDGWSAFGNGFFFIGEVTLYHSFFCLSSRATLALRSLREEGTRDPSPHLILSLLRPHRLAQDEHIGLKCSLWPSRWVSSPLVCHPVLRLPCVASAKKGHGIHPRI